MRTTLALALMGAMLTSVPVLAQTAGSTDTTRSTTTTTTTTTAPSTAASPLYEMKPGQWRATKLTGLSVYDPKNEKIGDINELIVARDGRIAAVVVGTGGFLGIGEHNSAIPFEQVQWVDEPLARTVATGTTSGSGTSTPAPATADRPASTTAGDRAAANRDAYRGYPDHAVVSMTKEQLKALPEVRYTR
jgi:sporulation protein YlmC with PRC-barrel domain